jgi:hypothetical protein
MCIYSDDEIVNLYQTECAVIEKCTLKGDYRKGNKAGTKIQSMFKYLEANIPQAIRVLGLLLQDANVVVRTKAAAHCLSLAILQKVALDVLDSIAKDESFGVFSFNASMTLQVYKKQGYLKVYPSQRILQR